MDIEHSLQPLTSESDRVVLTVRMSSDGKREWLDASGRVALVFFERGFWWARESDRHSRHKCVSELDALNALLTNRLRQVRYDAFTKAGLNPNLNTEED